MVVSGWVNVLEYFSLKQQTPQNLGTNLVVRKRCLSVQSKTLYPSVGQSTHDHKIDPKDSCSNGFTRMSSCAPCQGIPEVQPCPKYCLNVMRGCLAYHYELSQSWDDFIAHIQQLSDRLLGPFDVEAVVTPIGVKISDAIMSFQNAGYDVTAKVVQECGPTRLQKRQAQYGHAYAVNPNPRPLRPDQIHEETKLNLLIKEIRGKLESTKLFWNRLPTEMCNNDLIRSDKGRQFVVCWNGTSAGHYASNLVGEGLRPQESNPEIRVDVSRQDVDINEQILALRRMTKHLDDAINGQDVNWPSSRATNYRQSDESRTNQSQETEGSGAGCNPNSDDEDCYQYYDDDYYGGSGSGSGDYQDYPIHPSKNNQSPQEGSYEDNWPPWITSKSKDDDIEIESKSQEGEGTLYGDMGVINVGQRPDNHSGKKKHSSSGGLSLHTLRGLLYYLVPLVTCWIGNAAISW